MLWNCDSKLSTLRYSLLDINVTPYWAAPQPATAVRMQIQPRDFVARRQHSTQLQLCVPQVANGNLYCPATPRPLLQLGPLPPDATSEQAAGHDTQSAELARHKLGRITSDDGNGHHRVMCPAVLGKIRCPLRPASMTLDRDRPEILTPPEHPPACCAQQTITVPPQVAAKTLRTQSATSASPLKSASMTAIPVSASAEFRPGSPSGGARRRMSANERRSVK